MKSAVMHPEAIIVPGLFAALLLTMGTLYARVTNTRSDPFPMLLCTVTAFIAIGIIPALLTPQPYSILVLFVSEVITVGALLPRYIALVDDNAEAPDQLFMAGPV